MKTNAHVNKARLKIVYDLLERYQNLETEKMLPCLALRMLCVQHGYGKVVDEIETCGVDLMVLRCKTQFLNIATLWMRMIEENPPPPEAIEGVEDNLDMIFRAPNNVNVTARLYKALNRMALREQYLRSVTEPKSEDSTQ